MGAQTFEIANQVTGWPGFAGEKPANGRQTILLVEDEDFVRRVACQILCEAGYTVLAAKNAREALLAYEQHHGDVGLLMTDVVLPGESGRMLAQKICQLNSATKVLLMTGYAEQMGMKLAQHEDLLAKPFASAELLRRVARLLAREAEAVELKTGEDRKNQIRLACGIA